MATVLVRSPLQTEVQAFLRLAIPLASAQVAQSATGFVDTLMMGRLGQETLAAGGLASMTFLVLLNTAAGVILGASPLIAQAYGAGEKTRVEQVTRQGVWLLLGLTVPIVLLIAHLDSIMRHLGQAETTVVLSNTYLDIMLWGFFPALGFALLRSVVSAMSHARPIMAIVITGTLLNITGNYLLGFGHFGFPRLGIAGLALSSVFSLWVMFLALVGYIFQDPELKTYRFFANLHHIKPRILRELVRVGLPIGVASALELGLFTIVTYLMGILGTEVLAAHQIVFQTIAVVFMVPLGMSFATTVRVGWWVGQQDLEGARRAGYVSMGIGLGFLIPMAIVLLVLSRPLIGLYLDVQDPQNAIVVSLATSMLRVAAVAQILDGLQKTTMGALYGLQDTRVPMLLSFPAFWGVGLTTGYLLGFHTSLGGTGLWIGQSIGIAIAALVFVWRFRSLVRQSVLNLRVFPLESDRSVLK
ncbi:MATE family efflux transporter [Phormidesmis sp. 146-35]